MGRLQAEEQQPLVVAVGGGKGGVGKSVIALNLALAMAKLGARVTVVDADLGSANLHTMLGIDHPGRTLQALLDGEAPNLDVVGIPSGYPNLTLVPGTVAVPGAANLHHGRKQKLLRNIARLDADVVVVDCGAGIHFNVVDFFASADAHLLVASAQLISLQNAYGFLKSSLYRLLRQCAQDKGKVELFDHGSDGSEVETVEQLLERISVDDSALGDDLHQVLETTHCSLLGNQLGDARELNALQALSRMIGDFLALRVPVLGGLLRRDRIHAAVTRRKPFILDAHDPEAKLLLQIAEGYLNLPKLTAAPAPLDLTVQADPEESNNSALPRTERAYERNDVSGEHPVVKPAARGRGLSRGAA